MKFSVTSSNHILAGTEPADLAETKNSPSLSSTSNISSLSTTNRYMNQKRRDWNTFCQYLQTHNPPLTFLSCQANHVLQFLQYLDRFGKTKVHNQTCPYFGIPTPPFPCSCPLRQAWGSLDALVGRLRSAYKDHGGKQEANPFGTKEINTYLREVRDFQSKSRGVSYKKKRKRKKAQGSSDVLHAD